MNQIIGENKLIYWLNFLDSQIENKNSILLIATKLDILEKKFSFYSWGYFEKIDEIKLNERLNQINNRKKNFICIYFSFYLFNYI